MRSPEQQRAIVEFWDWWPRVRPRVEAAIAGGAWADLPTEVGARVSAIDPGLQWEFAKGGRATHAVVVCAAGRAELRATAARWLAAAPPVDATWEYHTARQPDPAALRADLEIDGHRLHLPDIRFGFTEDGERGEVHVVCHHPVFAGIPKEAGTRITFLALDWLLGEDAVERWVGGIDTATDPPSDAQPPQALAAAVARLAEQHREPAWTLLGGRTPDGWPVVATVQRPLKAVRWPRFDTHVAVRLPYRTQSENGLPDNDALQRLRAVEDALTEAAGRDAELLAHETVQGRRTLHYYADSGTAVVAALDRVLPGQLGITYDPALREVAHLS